MGKQKWKDTYQYKRIQEILNDYWLSEPNESEVIIDMFFRHTDGQTQRKIIRWQNPAICSHFKEWAVNKYENVDSPRGDFARDMRDDKDFPNIDDESVIYEYLIRNGACEGALKAFNAIWKVWQKHITPKPRTAKELDEIDNIEKFNIYNTEEE